MATERLNVILTMAAGQYNREARQAAQATGSIGTAAGASTTAMGGLRSGIRAIGPVATVAGVAFAGAMGKIAADSIRSASDLNESINAIRVTFGDAADDILEIGENSAQSLGLAKSEFNAFAVQFSNFAETVSQQTGQSIVQVVDDLTLRIADFASVMNLEVPEAAEKFNSALAGQSRPLQEFGIFISDANIKTFAYANGIAEAGAELSDQEKVLARYGLLMQETAKFAGDFANTSGDLANQQRIFNSELENARAEIGEELLPVMTDLLSTGRDLIPVLKELGGFLGTLGRGAALAFASNDLDRVAIASGGAADSAAALATAVDEVNQSARRGNQDVTGMRREYERLIDEWDGSTDEAIKLRNNLDFLVESGRLTAQQAELLGELLREDLAEGFREAEGAGKNFSRSGENTRKAIEDIFEVSKNPATIHDYADALGEVAASADLAHPSLREVADQTLRVNRAQLEAISPITRALGALDRMADASEELGKTTPGTEEYARAWLDVGEATAEANEAIAGLGGGNLERGIEALARNMDQPIEQVEEMLRLLGILDASQFETSVLVKFLASGDVQAREAIERGGGFGSGSTVTIDTADRRFFRQHGGPVAARQPYIVGERGRELFIPQTSGTVISNADIKQLLSGMSRQVNYTIPITSSGDQNTNAQLVGAVASVLRRMETI